MSTIRPIGDDDLQAFVDGRLSPERRGAVEEYLARHPGVAARIAAYAAQRRDLRDLLRFKAEEPIPARLRVDALARRRRHGATRRLALAASVALAVAAGALGGWMARGFADAGDRPWLDAAALAVGAHRVFVADARRPVELRADSEAQLVAWLSNRLGRPIAVPDLRAAQLRFMGGRLLATPDGPAAQLMYDDDSGTRLTVFLCADPRHEAVARNEARFVSIDGIGALNWSDRRFMVTVSAATDPGRLNDVGRLVRSQLSTERRAS